MYDPKKEAEDLMLKIVRAFAEATARAVENNALESMIAELLCGLQLVTGTKMSSADLERLMLNPTGLRLTLTEVSRAN